MEQLVDGQVEVEYEVAQEKPVAGWVGTCESGRDGRKEKGGNKKQSKRLAKRWSNTLITNCSGSRSERLATLLLRQTFPQLDHSR